MMAVRLVRGDREKFAGASCSPLDLLEPEDGDEGFGICPDGNARIPASWSTVKLADANDTMSPTAIAIVALGDLTSIETSADGLCIVALI